MKRIKNEKAYEADPSDSGAFGPERLIKATQSQSNEHKHWNHLQKRPQRQERENK